MKYLMFFITFVMILFVFMPGDTRAAGPSITTSAQIKKDALSINYDNDYRVNTLKNFFDNYNSPLASYAADFVYWADYYQIDWRLVPSISGVESTFGKRMPKGSYNAYGWAGGNYRFSSWEDSIEEVNKTLRLKYKDDGAVTLGQIAHRYAPPSSTWAWKVDFFMNKIDNTSLSFSL
jgi:hypothetical protein